jgi:NADPH:quinone reductase-like Zn-dependent oxidoreductase
MKAVIAVSRAAHCLPVPAGLSLAQAAGVPEAAFTVWHNLVELGRLRSGDNVLEANANVGKVVLTVWSPS